MARAADRSARGGVTIRGRLLALVLIAAFPVFLLALWNELDRRQQRAVEASEQVLQAARLIAAEQHQFFEAARTVPATYLQTPVVQAEDWETCGVYLSRLLAHFPHYTGYGVATPDGTIVCSSNPGTVGANIADRDYFRGLLAEKTLAVGDVMQGMVTGRWIVGAAYPLLDEQGEVRLVGVLGLDLERWAEAIAAPLLPPGSTVVLLDAAGTVMVHAPGGAGWIGQQAPEGLVDGAGAVDGLSREVDDEDGVRRLYAFAPLVAGQQIAVGVGIPVAPLFADIDRLFWREIALLGAVFVLVAAVAWVGGQATIGRPLAALQTAIDRVRVGDLSARGSASTTVPEFIQLGQSFDSMAETLERHEAELQRANADLRGALADRELLLKEMNHRVKNSLQLVASVLALQARGAADPELRRHLAEAQARVLTVARIHERLYQTDTIATVEFAQYLRDLCGEVAGTLRPAAEGPRVVVEAETADLPVHQAVPLALIANELVTNAFKYAYPAGTRNGTVAVRFTARRCGERCLEVADGGVGLSDDLDPQAGGGLGMRLVRALVQQLQGRLEVDRTGPGVRFAVSVPA